MYNAVLVSVLQQSESVIHTQTPDFLDNFPTQVLGPHRVLSGAPSTVQKVLISCLFYKQ